MQRNTYTSRISELRKIEPEPEDEKALPLRPGSEFELQSPIDDEEPVVYETATMTRISNDASYYGYESQPRTLPSAKLPRRRESLAPSYNPSYGPYGIPDQYAQPRSTSKTAMRDRVEEMRLDFAPQMQSQYMPPPLSPRRPPSPGASETTRANQPYLMPNNVGSASPARGHARAPSNESMSWLDTIDESGSPGSSVHSRTTSLRMRRKHIRAASGQTEAEFDAALDAAVEAAYDEGLEPMDDMETDDDDIIANVKRRVEMAKERVRETQREAGIQYANTQERNRQYREQQEWHPDVDDYENDSEEEERMLDEVTRGFVMDDFEFGLQSKSALPRESDSSGFSGRTWHSSTGSNPTTAGTSLSTVTEAAFALPGISSKSSPPSNPPPAQALPLLPPLSSSAPLNTITGLQGVRSRRLSGQNPKQLKIETSTRSPPAPLAPSTLLPAMPSPRLPKVAPPKTAAIMEQRELIVPTTRRAVPQSARQASSPLPGSIPSEVVSPPTPTVVQIDNDFHLPHSGSPTRPQTRPGMRKNFSSSSLKGVRSRNLSVSQFEDTGSDVSPITPMSGLFTSNLSRETTRHPALPTPIATAFRDKLSGAATGGLYLFSPIDSPESPGSPGSHDSIGGAIPLEPCPTEFLLRPFWLMRALYQTIAHPRGGYLSMKLFVPCDVWRVKGVKLKNVEDKIAACDFLTAALGRLTAVDSNDADAVLDEMQLFENVLEGVQATLGKKLGSEVGSGNAGGLFTTSSDADAGTAGGRSASIGTKSSSFSWRRLRTKNSGMNLGGAYTGKSNMAADGGLGGLSGMGASKEGLNMVTLPMTNLSVQPSAKFAWRDVSAVKFEGVNAVYMSALARLFDAVQIIGTFAASVFVNSRGSRKSSHLSSG